MLQGQLGQSLGSLTDNAAAGAVVGPVSQVGGSLCAQIMQQRATAEAEAQALSKKLQASEAPVQQQQAEAQDLKTKLQEAEAQAKQQQAEAQRLKQKLQAVEAALK